MKNKNSLFSLLLLTLAFNTLQATEDKIIKVIIETPANVSPTETYKKQLTEQTTQSINKISDATAASLKNNKADKEFENVLLKNVTDFLKACNTDAKAQNRKVTYTIENNKDTGTMTIKINCKEEKPKAEYWESIKDTVSSAASTVADKAKTAGTFVKEKAQVGATKIKDAAVVVKDTAKQGIHTSAEKISEITK